MTSCPRCHGPLPDPPERFCPHCGAEVALLAPTLPPPPLPSGDATPTTGWEPGPGAREGTPWERRAEIGFAAALIETTQRVITGPTAFFRAMPVTGGIVSPLLYALIIGYAGLVISSLYDFVLESVMGSSLSRFGSGSEAMAGVMPFFQGAMGLTMRLIVGPFFVAAGLFILAGVVHLVLLGLGAGARVFEATFRVACYSEAAALLNIVPVCGGILAPIGMLVLMIIGVSEAHAISRGRASAAVLLPIGLCCCCLLIPLIGALATVVGSLQQ